MIRARQHRRPLWRQAAIILAVAGLIGIGFGEGTALAQTDADDRIYFSGDPPSSVPPEPPLDCSSIPEEARVYAEEQKLCDESLGGTPVTGVTAYRMGLDCTNMTAEARAYANQQGLCEHTEVAPDDTRFGNCGWSWIYGSAGDRGTARLRYGFLTIQGSVVRRNLTVGYTRSRYPWLSWFFNDSGWMFSGFYQRSREVWVAAPTHVYAALGGTVRLSWGGTCAILYPSTYFWAP